MSNGMAPSSFFYQAAANQASNGNGRLPWNFGEDQPSSIVSRFYQYGAWAGSGPGASPRKEE